jgi:hypothetical protein
MNDESVNYSAKLIMERGMRFQLPVGMQSTDLFVGLNSVREKALFAANFSELKLRTAFLNTPKLTFFI